jgi:hypothetical protein
MINPYSRKSNGERGVALLVALFALMLLSAIGLGMMFSANTETNINANYREKQIATYAAASGVHEAKTRMGYGGDLTIPTGIPSTSAANVIYIINPASGETVAPWDYTNTYYDSELCQTKVMGLTGTTNTKCPKAATSFPSGSAWYGSFNNSASGYTGVYKLNPPISYKWTRIQLKTNNATPYPADGNASNGNQVCWNGINQIPRPAGYKVDCTPDGSITKITVVTGGNNYDLSNPPTVTIGAPPTGGTQATATATVVNTSGQLASIVVDSGGAGYTSVPTVQITGTGTGATATANIVAAGSPVTSLTKVNNGSPSTACWASGTTVALSMENSGGTGATGTANLSSNFDCIHALSFTGGTCSDKGVSATATISGGAGSGFSATVNVHNSGHLDQSTVSIDNPGSGYNNVNPTVSVSASCSGVTAIASLGRTLNTVTLNNQGAGYTSSPVVNFQPAPTKGSTPSITANIGTVQSGQVVSVTLTNPGSGYTSLPTVTFVGGCGTGSPPPACPTTATAHANFPGVIGSVTITNPGSGYLAPPAVTFSGGSGSGATAISSISAGTWYSPIYLLTSLGVSPNGARSMVQMEAAPSIRSISLPGALTLAGPQPDFGAPNSNNFMINGTDHPDGFVDSSTGATAPAPLGCDTATAAPHPAIGVYDDPSNPTSPSSVSTVLSDIPSSTITTNYPGLNASPDVQNVYGALGEQGTTPAGFESIVSSITGLPGAHIYTGNQSQTTIALGSLSAASPPVLTPAIDVVYGDVSLGGNISGYGILVVTGTLTFNGNFTWNGIVLAIGKGDIEFAGGGGGTINGSVLVAKTRDDAGNLLTQLGTPTLDWSGGGGNGIYYDHCYADGLLSLVPTTVPVSTKPLTVLSVKTLSY